MENEQKETVFTQARKGSRVISILYLRHIESLFDPEIYLSMHASVRNK